MTHLSDDTLNGYLDGALTDQERAAAEAHLLSCTACAGQLSALRAMFIELDALPELALADDLAPAVIARLDRPARLPGVIRWLALVQVAAVLCAVWLTWPLLKAGLSNELPIQLNALAEWAEAWVETWRLWIESLAAVRFSLPTGVISQLAFDRANAGLALLALCGLAAAWLVGNRLLLLPRTRRRL